DRVMALRQIEEVLIVPDLPATTRMSLLQTAKKVSQFLHEQAADPTKLTAKPPETAVEQKRAQTRAQREGVASLWVLGKRWFNEREIGSDRVFDKVSQDLNDPPKEENWTKPFLGLGAEVGKRWLRLPGAIEQRVLEARKELKLEKAGPRLAG